MLRRAGVVRGTGQGGLRVCQRRRRREGPPDHDHGHQRHGPRKRREARLLHGARVGHVLQQREDVVLRGQPRDKEKGGAAGGPVVRRGDQQLRRQGGAAVRDELLCQRRHRIRLVFGVQRSGDRTPREDGRRHARAQGNRRSRVRPDVREGDLPAVHHESARESRDVQRRDARQEHHRGGEQGQLAHRRQGAAGEHPVLQHLKSTLSSKVVSSPPEAGPS
mmetsp:Transcript_22593/g.54209  ORF Transcript_22593/g.54209 Transcript_22593/m.54209 type:complete len:220 (+) Transcript_22593:848-1507(+)